MAHTLDGEVRRVNFNLLWCNALILLASLAVAGLPFLFGPGTHKEPSFWKDALVFWIIAIIPALVSAVNLAKYLQRSQQPESHPFLRQIKGRGFGVQQSADQDLYGAQDFFCLTLGRSWLLRRGFFDLDLAALGDVMWAHKNSINSGHLFSFQAAVHLRSGKILLSETSTDNKKADVFLDELSKRAPWALLGENDVLEKLWKKDQADFVAQVDQRRKTLELGKNSSSAPQ